LGTGNVSRVWHQWIDGNKVVWPADELPHPKAIFKANFINQFIAWIRYLNYIGPLVDHIPDYIAAGDIIQGASFWNSLIINPDTSNFDRWSYRWQYTLSDLTQTGPLPHASIKTLYEINGWEEATTPLISRGDNLQRMIRVWLRNLRWKLDRCSTYYNTGCIGHMKGCEWGDPKYYPPWERCTDYGDTSWIIPTIQMSGSVVDGYSGMGFQFSGIHTTSKQAFCTLFAFIYSYEPSVFPFPYPGADNYEILAAGAGGVTYGSHLPTSLPVWGKIINCGLDITQAFTAYDSLPAGFEAPES
jgi:hypothetical protein